MKETSPIQDIERILVIRNDGIGDVINATPAISALRSAYRNAHISVLVQPPGAEVLLFNPHIDEILVYDASVKLHFLRRLRAGNYNMAVVLQNSSWCNFMAYISGARYRVGRRSERKRFSFALTHFITVGDPKGTKHEVDRNMDLVRLIGTRNGASELVLRLSEEERVWAEDFLHRHESEKHSHMPLIGIHPGGSSYDKLWPAERFGRVAKELVQKYGARIILFSGPGEDTLLRDIQKAMTTQSSASEVIAAEGLSLRQFSALAEKCSLFLCNDSGPMHIAAALKVPTVAIFGPTDHVRWRPRNQKAIVVRKDMDCWPCSAHKCKRGFECIKSLPAECVLEAANELMGL